MASRKRRNKDITFQLKSNSIVAGILGVEEMLNIQQNELTSIL